MKDTGLHHKRTIIRILISIVIIGFLCAMSEEMLLKTTYTEYQSISGKSDGYIKLENSSDRLVQEFIAPYDIINNVGIQIGTFARINNSLWKIDIICKKDEKIVCSEIFSAAEIADNGYHMINLSKNVRLNKGETYSLSVYSINATSNTSLAFHTSSEARPNASTFFSNGETVNNTVLCLRIYGCDTDYFWLGIYIFTICVISIAIILAFRLHKAGINPMHNKRMQSLLLFIVVFCLLYVFSKNGITFTDENDNIRGGMIIAKGGILYKDYITQHTPVTYYLCAGFALLGAGSVQQFRCCYYVVVATFFSIIFYRHVSYWGRKRLFLIPICIIVITTTFNVQGYMILSDNIQGICMLALCMEFLRYYDDRTISLSRCVIVSICVWGSIGSAFISVYALSIIVLAVIMLEINDWRTPKYSLHIGGLIRRYVKLSTTIIAPFICAVAYFKFNGTLRIAYDQVYRFNREIYLHYTDSGTGFTNCGYGSNVVQPYLLGIKNYFSLISDKLNAVFSDISTSGNTQLLIAVLLGIVLILLLFKKKFTLGVTLFLFSCCNMTRGYGFHSVAFWYVAIALIILFWPTRFLTALNSYRSVISAMVCMFIIYCMSPFVNNVCTYLFQKQSTISELEQYIVSITDEEERVFIDTYTCDSIYLLYKQRYPVNRLTYFLPWYLAWYEQAAIDDLNAYSPNVVIYNPDLVTWTVHSGYSAAFCEATNANYKQLSDSVDNDWKYYVWMRRENCR